MVKEFRSTDEVLAWRREQAVARAADQVTPVWHDVAQLESVVSQLSTRDAEFAASLLGQFKLRGSLTEKQLFWVRQLVIRVAQRGPAQPVPTPSSIARPPMVRGLAFSKLAELFAKAGPRAVVVLRTKGGQDFRLSVAGQNSQHRGNVHVTDTNPSFDSRTWFGRIEPTGGWVASRKVDPAALRAVEAALMEFETDPTAAASSYGHSTGSCCFCQRELTDERSVSVGYGPVCAERWGRPWGEVPGKLTCEEAKAEQRQVISDAEIPF